MTTAWSLDCGCTLFADRRSRTIRMLRLPGSTAPLRCGAWSGQGQVTFAGQLHRPVTFALAGAAESGVHPLCPLGPCDFPGWRRAGRRCADDRNGGLRPAKRRGQIQCRLPYWSRDHREPRLPRWHPASRPTVPPAARRRPGRHDLVSFRGLAARKRHEIMRKTETGGASPGWRSRRHQACGPRQRKACVTRAHPETADSCEVSGIVVRQGIA
jgi:hypothetical protein